MQQTKKYSFNLIETSDTFSPDPLNENAKKIEAALAETDARLTDADSALAGRVQTLEVRRFAAGTYQGGDVNTTQFIPLDFAPKVVIASTPYGLGYLAMATEGNSCRSTNSSNPDPLLQVDGNGFRVSSSLNGGYKYNYLALA